MVKKIKKIILLGVVLILGLSIFAGCGNNELESIIRSDYLRYMHSQGYEEMTLADVRILQNFGNFNEVVVVRMERPAFTMVTTVQISGVNLTFSDSNIAIVWRDGYFYELQEAYDNEFLTRENLIFIANMLNRCQ